MSTPKTSFWIWFTLGLNYFGRHLGSALWRVVKALTSRGNWKTLGIFVVTSFRLVLEDVWEQLSVISFICGIFTPLFLGLFLGTITPPIWVFFPSPPLFLIGFYTFWYQFYRDPYHVKEASGSSNGLISHE